MPAVVDGCRQVSDAVVEIVAARSHSREPGVRRSSVEKAIEGVTDIVCAQHADMLTRRRLGHAAVFGDDVLEQVVALGSRRLIRHPSKRLIEVAFGHRPPGQASRGDAVEPEDSASLTQVTPAHQVPTVADAGQTQRRDTQAA